MKQLHHMGWLFIFESIIGIHSPLLSQEPPSNDKQFQSFQFSVVQIPVWVTDKKNVPVANLKKEDFFLFVDGRQADIENCMQAYDRPMEIVYLIDISGSMAVGEKLQGSIDALSTLIQNHRPDDRWRIIAFSDGQVVKALDHTQAEHWPALSAKLRAYGQTALFDALSTADHYFDQDSLTNRAIVLFTDGNDNRSLLTEEQLLEVLRVVDVPVFVIAIADGFVPSQPDDDYGISLPTLRLIPKITGGELFIAKDSTHLPQVSTVLTERMRPQYLLTMTVERNKSDRRHQLVVKLRRKLSSRVRYRTGYFGSLPYPSGGLE